MFQSKSCLVAPDISQSVGFVQIVILIVFESEGRIGRQFIIPADASVQIDRSE